MVSGLVFRVGGLEGTWGLGNSNCGMDLVKHIQKAKYFGRWEYGLVPLVTSVTLRHKAF